MSASFYLVPGWIHEENSSLFVAVNQEIVQVKNDNKEMSKEKLNEILLL